MRHSLIIATVVILSLVPTSHTSAYFQDLGVGVRPMGMGGAYVALADDATASYWNPAGLLQLQRPELYTSYATLHNRLAAQIFDGREDAFGLHFVGYAHPLGKSAVAMGWLFFNTLLYDEHTFVWSQAIHVLPTLAIGGSMKLLYARIADSPYIARDPDLVSASLTQTGFTLDVGGIYHASRQVRFGFRAANIRPVQMNWLDQEPLPIVLTMGMAIHLGDLLQLFDMVIDENEPIQYRWGGEYWFLKQQLGVRAGTDFQTLTTGFSLRHIWQRIEFQLDYALLYPISSIEETLGSHRLALVVRF